MNKEYDFIIAGGGHSGLVLAKELSNKNKKILVLEKGGFADRLGTTLAVAPLYEKFAFAGSRQGVPIFRTFCIGGTGIVGCGNAVEFTDKEYDTLQIDFKPLLAEAKKESCARVEGLPVSIGIASKRIMREANKLGYDMGPMPKFSITGKCISCGRCIGGCKYGVKWTSRECLKSSKKENLDLFTNVAVEKVIESNGKAIGIETTSKKRYFADKIILSAGGIGTPIILQNSGLGAGKNLFVDLFTMTYGVSKEYNQRNELPMSVVCTKFHASDGFVMAPFVDYNFLPLLSGLRLSQLLNVQKVDKLMGIMVKINDDNIGRVNRDGAIDKEPTHNDRSKLKKGSDIAREILINCGVDHKSIFVTKAKGAHPGGTAAIGEVVDKNLQTEMKNLYVCDCSVFPSAPGLPPMLSLVALSKWFANNVSKN